MRLVASPLLKAWVLACVGQGLASPNLVAAPSFSVGVLGGVFNTNYQKSAANATGASVEDGRREDIDGGGQPAGSTSSHASASAEPGKLHLSLSAVATAAIVLETFWGHSASASGNASFSDTFRVDLPGVPTGTLVDVAVTFGVDAAVSEVHGGAYLEGTAAVGSDADQVVEIQYQNSGLQSPASSITINHQAQPLAIVYGQESVVAKFHTGATYRVDAIIQGRVDASADINPGLDPSARIPFSRGTVEAANTAHVGLQPLVPGAVIVSSSGTNYAYPDAGPKLLGSASLDGPFEPVPGAYLDFLDQSVVAPAPVGAQQFFRLSGRLGWSIQGVALKDGLVRIRY